MAERQLSNVPDITEDTIFDEDIAALLNANGRFRDIATILLRNALSKAMLHAQARDPADSELVTGLTQYWVNTESKARFISVAGADWVDVTPTATNTRLTDEELQDKIAAFLAEGSNVTLTYDDEAGTLTISATGTDSGSGLTAEQVRDIVAAFIQGGTNVTVNHDDDNDTFTIEATDTNTQLTDEEFQDKLNSLITAGSNITIDYDDDANTFTISATDGGLAAVATDETLQGDGTAESPLGVVSSSSEASGEVGRILSIGSYTLGISTTPAAEHAGYTGGNLYIHTTASDGDKSTILASLSQGDYIHIGTEAIVEIVSAPSSASSIYTLTVAVLDGEVPTSESHTLYYIKENRALIAGAVHGFNIANGAVLLAHLASEVLTNWLSAVATDSSLDGDGTSGSALGIADGGVLAAHLDAQAIKANGPTVLGSWRRDGSNGGNSGSFQVFRSLGAAQLYINATDADGTNRQTELLALRSGDKLSVAGTLLTLTATPTGSNAIAILGTWPGDTIPPTTTGETYTIINISRDILAINERRTGTFLGVDENLNLIWGTPQAGQQDDSGDAAADINSGTYTVLGDWERGSASLPDTGKYYTEASSVVLNPTDANGMARGDVIQTLGVGDRIQFDRINAFVLSAVPTNVNGWSMSGSWVKTWSAGDFDGEHPLYLIKKNNVVVRNNVVPGRFLKLNDDLEIEANDPADSLETIWEGEFTSATTGRQSLNAGKKFSGYTHVIFNYSGINRRNLWTVPVALWDALNATEFGNRDARLALTHRSDTEFELAAGDSGITLYKIYGYKGV
ncbi:MAG: hypothetical protein OXH00_02675 [Candidatus Poribacteria bacterium]|nr:hypothetical protein [Candidatus Poribacteria bacterium]